MENIKKPELLSPAGDLEVLKVAVTYGADAVYMGGAQYGLRANARNFNLDQIKEGVEFAHRHNVKVYITANILAHNDDLEGMGEYFKALYEIGVDALIISDPGVVSIAKEYAPEMEIHLSTQANTTNYRSFNFWHDMGIKRVVSARELSLEELKKAKKNSKQTLEIEAFVHGAMCISYSGRCLLSNYFINRNSNKGDCAHPCRWRYHIVEETRPGNYMPIEQDERGTYIFNSKDLCMVQHIPDLIEAGIDSLKIEGRMKTAYYVATVIKAYRQAIDDYFEDPNIYEQKKEFYLSEICKSSYRDYTTGFYYSKPGNTEQIYDRNTYIRDYNFNAIVLDYDANSQIATVEQRYKFCVNDEVEFLRSKGETFTQKIEYMTNDEGEELQEAPHPKQIIKVKVVQPVQKYDIMRTKK